MFKSLLSAVILTASLWSTGALAALDIYITEGLAGARPIAIVPFKNLGQYQPPFPIEKVVGKKFCRNKSE